MVDFRGNIAKRQAVDIINRALSDGEYTKNYICLKVIEKTGCSELFVRRYLEMLEEDGKIIETRDKIVGFKATVI